jgi:glycosyltransferase involved in cell wall biosynthesis
LHILIIPPEEFVPTDEPLSGIFQYDQATALLRKGIQIGVISVTKPIALFPSLVSFFRKIIGKKVFYKVLEGKSIWQILGLIVKQFISSENLTYEQLNGVNVIRIQCRCWNDTATGSQSELSYFHYCIRKAAICYENKYDVPDLIHAHNVWLAGLSAWELSVKWRIPFGITEHSTFFARNLIPVSFNSVLNKCYTASKFNLVVSESLGQLLKERNLLTDNYVYLPNMLDTLFEHVRPSEKHESGPFIFLTIGVLTEKKAQDILIRSFSKSFRGNDHVQLVVGGGGDMESVLKRIVMEEDLSTQVTFTGLLSRNQVLEQMQKCDVFVLPSQYETFGVVLIEAMALGKPVIATRSGGPETFVNDANGLLVTPGQIDELSAAMESFFKRDIILNENIIRNETIKKFSADTISSALIKIYDNLLNAKDE